MPFQSFLLKQNVAHFPRDPSCLSLLAIHLKNSGLSYDAVKDMNSRWNISECYCIPYSFIPKHPPSLHCSMFVYCMAVTFCQLVIDYVSQSTGSAIWEIVGTQGTLCLPVFIPLFVMWHKHFSPDRNFEAKRESGK